MSDISLNIGGQSEVGAVDEFVQRKWDRFVTGRDFSLNTTIPLPSRVAKATLVKWANEFFPAADTTRELSHAVASVRSTDRGRHNSEVGYVAAFTTGPGEEGRLNHVDQSGDTTELHEQRS